jgi:hypothetical protein
MFVQTFYVKIPGIIFTLPEDVKTVIFRAPGALAFGRFEKERLKCEGKRKPMRGCDRC